MEAVLAICVEGGGGLYYRILNGNDGPESAGLWESGLCVMLWSSRRLREPGPGHAATSTITGCGWEASRGSGMAERLRCQTPSTTVKPVPQTHCWRPLTHWSHVPGWKKDSPKLRGCLHQ